MAFDEGKVSMPMGELYDGVVFLVALIAAHPEVRAVYWFTDCDAAKAAVNSGLSPTVVEFWDPYRNDSQM